MQQPIPANYLPPRSSVPEVIKPLPELYYPEKLNLAYELLRKHVEHGKGESVALLYRDQKISYAEMDRVTNRWANALRYIGIQAGDRVILRLDNTPDFVYAYYALWKLNAIAVPIMSQVRETEIHYRIEDSGAKIALCHKSQVEDVLKAKVLIDRPFHVYLLDGQMDDALDFMALVQMASDEYVEINSDFDDIAILMYTSGTTGHAKGVIKRHYSLLALADTYGKYVLGLKEDDVSGGTPTMAFAYGAYNFVVLPFRFVAALSLWDGRDGVESVWQTIQNHRITVFQSVPLFFKNLLSIQDFQKKYNISSLRLAETASGPVSSDLVIRWREMTGTEMINSLGSTELNYTLTTLPGRAMETYREQAGAAGYPLHGTIYRLIDEDGNDVPVGGEGELLVKQPWAIEFWRKPDKQKEVFYDGWNRPGLIYRRDENGCLWYVSRTDDLIKTSGFSVPPEEVESVLVQHDAVLECAVIGAPPPADKKEIGEVVRALVVLRSGIEPSENLKEEIMQFAAERVRAAYMKPRQLIFVTDLPKTPTMKVKRRLLKQQAWERVNN